MSIIATPFETQGRHSVAPDARYYACKKCQTEIRFAFIEALEKRHTPQAGLALDIVYTCPNPACSPGEALQTLCRADAQAYRRLCKGVKPQLPYRAAPGASIPMDEAREAAIQAFADQLTGIGGADAFIWACGERQEGDE